MDLNPLYFLLGPQFFDYIFGCNGSEFYDVKKGTSELIASLDLTTLHKIGEKLRCDFATLAVYDGLGSKISQPMHFEAIRTWAKRHEMVPEVVNFTAEKIYPHDLDKAYAKAILIHNNEDRPKVDALIKDIDDPAFDLYYSSPIILEIAPKGVNKKLIVDKVSELLDIKSEEIMSFGDSENDLPMLENAYGVLMGNAEEKLKTAFPRVIGSIYDDGLSAYLKEEELI